MKWYTCLFLVLVTVAFLLRSPVVTSWAQTDEDFTDNKDDTIFYTEPPEAHITPTEWSMLLVSISTVERRVKELEELTHEALTVAEELGYVVGTLNERLADLEKE